MKDTLHQAFSLAREEADGLVRRRLAFTLVLVLGTAVFAALAPIALKFAVDGLSAGTEGAAAAVPPPESGTLSRLAGAMAPVSLVLLYILSLWLSRSLGEIRWFLFGTADQRLHRRLSRRLIGHVIDLPMSFHVERRTGALNQTLVQGLAGYRVLLNHAVFTVLPVLIEVLMIAGVLVFLFEPLYLAILAASVIAYGAAFWRGAKRIIGPSREVSSSQVEAYANLTDSVLNAETVKCFNAERHIGARYDETLARSEAHWSVFYWRKSLNGLLVAFIFALSLGAAVTAGAFQVEAGLMTVGDFVLVNAYMLQIVRPLETLGAAFRDVAYGIAFIEKMLDLLDLRPETQAPRQPLPERKQNEEAGKPGELVLKDVGFSYLPERPVLDGVSFNLPRGRSVAIVGGSGAGKSSLARLILRLYEPGRGEIRLDGTPIRDMTLAALRQSIAVVPQDTVLFNDSIAYNIGIGRAGASRSEIEEAARLAHIHERIAAMPEGYESIVGERGLKLSGGEKQRVSIARAVLKRPRLFIFDEATSSLDTRTEQGILESLMEVSEGMTTLIIAHRLSTVVHADEILVLERGRITERGKHDDLLRKNGSYAAMWRAQHRRSGRAAARRKEPA